MGHLNYLFCSICGKLWRKSEILWKNCYFLKFLAYVEYSTGVEYSTCDTPYNPFFQGFLQNRVYRCWIWDKPLPLWCENTSRCILLENNVDRPISGRNRPNLNFEIQNPQIKISIYDENLRSHRFWSRCLKMTVDKVLGSLKIILFENQTY